MEFATAADALTFFDEQRSVMNWTTAVRDRIRDLQEMAAVETC